ncbi:hypothetical protein HBH51_083840 [Parastagonospora nodorum]|nr:hypothetical protein HBH51_083840 [Parastagonospora nodorum]
MQNCSPLDQKSEHLCMLVGNWTHQGMLGFQFEGLVRVDILVCPKVFELAPTQAAPLPIPELSSCVPGVMPDKDDVFAEEICNNKRLKGVERVRLWQAFDRPPRSMCTKKRSAEVRHRQISLEKTPRANRAAFQKRFAGQLVKSRDLGQSAVGTCNSRNSVGPNFFSYHEGKFCDMEKHKLYPQCEGHAHTECFDE